MEEKLLSPTSFSPHIKNVNTKIYPKISLCDPLFSLIDPILELANIKGSIDNQDLYYLPSQYSSKILMDEYLELYSQSKDVLFALIKVLGFLGICMIVSVFLSTILEYADPLLLKYMIKFISDPSSSTNSSLYFLILAALIILLLRTLLDQHSIHIGYLCNVRTANSVFGLLYAKTLRISNSAKSLLGTGKIMNILHGDGKVVANFIHGFNEVWTTPIEIFVALWLLYSEIHWYALMGAGIIMFGVFIQKLVYNKYTEIRRKMYKYTDARSKYLNEYFEGIKIIKCNAWEDFAYANIKDARKSEASLQFKGEMLKVVNEIMIPLLMILTILIIYILEGQALSAEKTFTVLALYKKLESPLGSISSVFSWYAKFRLSLQRINLYMKTPESINAIDYHTKNSKEIELIGKYKPPYNSGEAHLYNCSYSWVDRNTIDHAVSVHSLLKKGKTGSAVSALSKFSTAPCLQDITLHIKKGELVAIVGEIGSGKSAILQGMIGELIRIKGFEEIGGIIRYVPQTPWIINSTIENNIRLNITTSDISREKYEQIFSDCDLDIDVRLFPDRDQAEIGARGVNLSGGQRARIGIAREILAGGDIFLFDDCLSALDPQVAAKIFSRVILNGLKDRTRIFVTHAFHLAALTERIIVIKDGKIVEQGKYEDLLKLNGEFCRLQAGGTTGSIATREILKSISPVKKKKSKKEKVEKMGNPDNQKQQAEKNLVNNQEKKAIGHISWFHYWKLLKYGGAMKSVFGIISFFIVDILMAIIQWWLAIWTSNKYGKGIMFYAIIYSLFSLLYCLSLFIRKMIIAYFQYNISLKSQTALVKNLLHAQITWFDNNPVGRILNRAVKDQAIVDYLGTAIAGAAQKCVSLIVSFCVIGIITPYFLLALVFLVSLYIYWYNHSIQAARDARRINSINHSPMYAIFNEILDGLINIRLGNLENVFMSRQQNYLDTSVRSMIFKEYCSRWINLRIEILGAFAVASASIFLAFEKGSILGSIAGFSLLNSISIASKLGSMLLAITDVETSMASTERISEYINDTPLEKSYTQEVPRLKNWPNKGEIDISELSTSYKSDGRLVLINLNFHVNPGEKIGVVGRTGSGKSTLSLALLRILEPVHPHNISTRIKIDGIDAESIGLKYLRSSIGIIGQEPILFSGTIRSNLDPFNLYSDDNLLNVLEKVQVMPMLKKKVEEEWIEQHMKDQQKHEYNILLQDPRNSVLSLIVRERGENFSLGERQLICLARVIAKHPKILILDEATASVDEATDSRIQEMIRQEFKNTTVVIIAHRVKSLMECDKILVLDEGRIQGFDSPKNLIEKKSGFFYESVKQIINN